MRRAPRASCDLVWGFSNPTAATIGTLGLGGDAFGLAADRLGAAISRNFQATGTPIRAGWSPLTLGGQPVNLLSASGGFNDPVFSSGGGGWGGTDWGSIIGGVANLGFGYATAKQQAKALKRLAKLRMNVPSFGAGSMLQQLGGVGGGPIMNFAPSASSGLGGALAGALGGLATGLTLPSLGGLTDMLPGGLEEGGTGVFGPDLFAPVAGGRRQRMISAPNDSGEMVYWRPVGKPVMFTGDLALLKRTRKVLGKFNSFGPARCLRRRRRR